MDVTQTAAASAATSQSASSQKTLSSNFDTFLKLLTAQLQNQDPLQPMDSSQFTQQLVQYSSVEQGIYTNQNLETLIGLQQGGGLGSAVSYIGRDVTAASSDAALSGGQASWTYTLPRAAASVSLTVTDASGNTVYTGTGPTAAGKNTVGWDGTMANGNTAPDGTYTLSVNAADSSGAAMSAPLTVSGLVSGAETVNGAVMLDVGGIKIKVSDVTSVSTAAAATGS